MSNLTDQEWEIVPTKEVPAPGGGTMVVNAEPVDPWAATVPNLDLGAPAESVPVTKTPRQSRRVPTVPKTAKSTAKSTAKPTAKPAATRTLKVVPSSADPTSAPEAAAPTEATAKRRGRKPAAEKPQPEPT